MSKQNLIIYDFENLYNILYEIKDTLNYKLIDVRKDLSDLNINKLDDYLIITQKKYQITQSINYRYLSSKNWKNFRIN